jgi:hypothetical protein
MKDLFDSMVPSSLISTDGFSLGMNKMSDDREESPLVVSWDTEENFILCLLKINPENDVLRYTILSSSSKPRYFRVLVSTLLQITNQERENTHPLV